MRSPRLSETFSSGGAATCVGAAARGAFPAGAALGAIASGADGSANEPDDDVSVPRSNVPESGAGAKDESNDELPASALDDASPAAAASGANDESSGGLRATWNGAVPPGTNATSSA